MTPDETSPVPVDAQLLAHMMACDAAPPRLRHAAPCGMSECSPTTTEEDDRRAQPVAGNFCSKLLEEAPEIAAVGARPVRSLSWIAESPRKVVTLLGHRFQVLKRARLRRVWLRRPHLREIQLLGRDVALKMPLPEPRDHGG